MLLYRPRVIKNQSLLSYYDTHSAISSLTLLLCQILIKPCKQFFFQGSTLTQVQPLDIGSEEPEETYSEEPYKVLQELISDNMQNMKGSVHSWQ